MLLKTFLHPVTHASLQLFRDSRDYLLGDIAVLRRRFYTKAKALLRAHESILLLLSYTVATQEQFHFQSAKIFARAFFRRRPVTDSSCS